MASRDESSSGTGNLDDGTINVPGPSSSTSDRIEVPSTSVMASGGPRTTEPDAQQTVAVQAIASSSSTSTAEAAAATTTAPPPRQPASPLWDTWPIASTSSLPPPSSTTATDELDRQYAAAMFSAFDSSALGQAASNLQTMSSRVEGLRSQLTETINQYDAAREQTIELERNMVVESNGTGPTRYATTVGAAADAVGRAYQRMRARVDGDAASSSSEPSGSSSPSLVGTRDEQARILRGVVDLRARLDDLRDASNSLRSTASRMPAPLEWRATPPAQEDDGMTTRGRRVMARRTLEAPAETTAEAAAADLNGLLSEIDTSLEAMHRSSVQSTSSSDPLPSLSTRSSARRTWFDSPSWTRMPAIYNPTFSAPSPPTSNPPSAPTVVTITRRPELVVPPPRRVIRIIGNPEPATGPPPPERDGSPGPPPLVDPITYRTDEEEAALRRTESTTSTNTITTRPLSRQMMLRVGPPPATSANPTTTIVVAPSNTQRSESPWASADPTQPPPITYPSTYIPMSDGYVAAPQPYPQPRPARRRRGWMREDPNGDEIISDDESEVLARQQDRRQRSRLTSQSTTNVSDPHDYLSYLSRTGSRTTEGENHDEQDNKPAADETNAATSGLTGQPANGNLRPVASNVTRLNFSGAPFTPSPLPMDLSDMTTPMMIVNDGRRRLMNPPQPLHGSVARARAAAHAKGSRRLPRKVPDPIGR